MKLMSSICGVALLGIIAIPTLAEEEKPVTTKEKCHCEAMKVAKSGWCEACENGMFLGATTKSLAVYQLLAGVKIPDDVAGLECEGCRKAIEASKKDKVSTCATCKKTVKDGRIYGSKYALVLASGVLSEKLDADCEECQEDVAAKKGFCDHCDVGVVGNRLFKGKKSYDNAMAAKKIALAAMEVAKKCEECAIGMLTDGKCEECDAEFKDGKLIKNN